MVFKLPKKEVMISPESGKEVIKKELPLIPKLPGVYRMLNHKNEILYVGKAKNLPNRLKSYVAEKNHIIRTERMLSQTKKLEITTTSNESEALLLGTGEARSFVDLGRAVFKALNVKDEKFVWIDMPDSLKNQYQYFTEANITKLREKAHYTKKLHSLEDGVYDYVVNYLNQEDSYL